MKTVNFTTLRAVQPTETAFSYTAALQAADGSAGAATLAITLAQLGSAAASLPEATATIPL